MEGGDFFSGILIPRSDQMGAPFTRLRKSDPVSGLGLKSRVQGRYELHRCHPSGGLQPALGSVLQASRGKVLGMERRLQKFCVDSKINLLYK